MTKQIAQTNVAPDAVGYLPIPPASILDNWKLANSADEFNLERSLDVVKANLPQSKERLKSLIVNLIQESGAVAR